MKASCLDTSAARSPTLSRQRGRLELAQGGTVFLDEVGELAPPLQAKLVRVLEQRVVDRVGGRRSVPIGVRVIAATNRDLEQPGRRPLRQDLFYRLNVVPYHVPRAILLRHDWPGNVRKLSNTIERCGRSSEVLPISCTTMRSDSRSIRRQ